MFFGPLMFIALIVLVVYLVNGSAGWNSRKATWIESRSALDILDERLARGDINRREYDQKRRLLEQG